MASSFWFHSQKVNLADYNVLSLDAAVNIGVLLAREAAVAVASWSLLSHVDAYIPHLEGCAAAIGLLLDSRFADFAVRRLFDEIATVGSVAIYTSRDYSRLQAGIILQDVGYYVSTTSYIMMSDVNFPAQAYDSFLSGLNSLHADRLLDSAGLGSGVPAVQNFLDRQQVRKD